MRYQFIFASTLMTILIAACNKDKFTTEPQVKVKSVSPETVIKGHIITFTSAFTDEEGDVQDSVLAVFKRYNGATIITTDTFRHKLTDEISKARQGNIIVQFSYGEINPPYTFLNPETTDMEVTFGIIIRDNAGHRSNYSESDKITLKKP